MRMTGEMNDELIETALRESGVRSKRAVVEEGLRALIQQHRCKKLLMAFGKYPWDGDQPEQHRSW